MIIYGVKLTYYSGVVFDSWVWGENSPFKSQDKEAAQAHANEMTLHNPKGIYVVEPFVE